MSEYLTKSKAYKGFHYSVLTPEMLDYLHKTTLRMLRLIVDVLDRNDIRYMICGGTLLGAETTGKFIPWDDDVDMCVMEEDYEKMRKILIESMPDWVVVQCNQTEPRYYHGWIKVRDKNSRVYPDEPSYSQNGVWVDIYMLKQIPSDNIVGFIASEHYRYLKRRFEVGALSHDEMEKRIRDNNLLERTKHCPKAMGGGKQSLYHLFRLKDCCKKGMVLSSKEG